MGKRIPAKKRMKLTMKGCFYTIGVIFMIAADGLCLLPFFIGNNLEAKNERDYVRTCRAYTG